VPFLLLVLTLNNFGLLCLLPLAQVDGFLHLALFLLPLLVHHVVLSALVLLLLVLQLVVVDLLLDAILVAVLQRNDLVGALAGGLNFSPGLVFLLPKQRYSVSEQLGVPLNTITA